METKETKQVKKAKKTETPAEANDSQKAKETKESNIHKEHRSRIKERYAATHFQGFSQHEVLELLLFYVIPRQDVNPVAHALIEQFGSLSRVLDAPVDVLGKVKGMGPAAAQYLKLFPDVTRLYLIDRQTSIHALNTHRKVRDHLQPHFSTLRNEKLMLLLLDNAMHPLCCECISEGTASNVQVAYRRIAELVVKYNATAAILAHNHPSGIPFPSDSDKSITMAAVQFLDALNVSLIDHFIFTDTTCVPMRLQDRSLFRSHQSDSFDNQFYNTFYQLNTESDDRPTAALRNTLLENLDKPDNKKGKQ